MLPPPLVALTPGRLEERDGPALLVALERALAAGLPGVLLRESRLPDRPWLALAREVRRRLDACERHVWFGVHDRAHLVEEVRADALHLGFRSLPAAAVRPASRTTTWSLGISAHEEDEPASWDGADYLFFGPVHEPGSKSQGDPGRRSPTGFDGLARAVVRAGCPVLALGGLEPEHVASARSAGASGIAVLSGWLAAGEPGARTRDYLDALAAAGFPDGGRGGAP